MWAVHKTMSGNVVTWGMQAHASMNVMNVVSGQGMGKMGQMDCYVHVVSRVKRRQAMTTSNNYKHLKLSNPCDEPFIFSVCDVGLLHFGHFGVRCDSLRPTADR